MEHQVTQAVGPEYSQACQLYRELRDQCEALTARRVTGAELVDAIEWKCRRLGELIRELRRRSRS